MEELCGVCVFRIACLMIWIGVCMFAVDVVACQLGGHIFVWLWMLNMEVAMLSAEFFRTSKTKVVQTSLLVPLVEELCGHCACRIACVMVRVGVCMFAVDVVASQLCGYVAVWVWMLKIEGAMLSAEFFHNDKNNSFSNTTSFSFCGRTL